MDNFISNLAIDRELRNGFNCIKLGLVQFSRFNSSYQELFAPFLLLSVGIERILKILYILNNYNINGEFPKKEELRNLGHKLDVLINIFVETCSSYELYRIAPARISDLDFLNNNSDFKEIIKILTHFSSEKGRYHNLNLLNDEELYWESPENLNSRFLNQKFENRKDIMDMINNPPYNTDMLYIEFNKIVISSIQRFCRILCFGFTQGAYGDLARQKSAFYVGEFLSIKDEDLHKINFKI
ncbi:MAG: hypothetical protein A2X64_06905 [Ignavibacteria bacterium GWF2_33_9]|nr:MAG: hypothetical protein A2X64_06905 [Ignavibacteria bacterium GWF2_33_9]